MNADTFDRGSHACPVCHRTGNFVSVNSVNGLLTCPHCRSRLVVSISGHYVRDPFSVKKLKPSSRQLRKQSRPIARIMRDSGLAKHSPLITILSSLIVAGFSIAVLSQPGAQKLPNWVQQTILKNTDLKN
ncbi:MULTISPECIES: hypothetical protein [Leptolyngbya]|jgi:uncharacterized protein YbaR (Trm112 family)|uniref:Uncharacterized protein n=2 Tax=Leptolyngbya boryana TaxID=1184 RepID=A0A1Z4JFF2_LEPBY|nr:MULTISPECIES: hypothetical protein [Leptolyngbya]BAY55479.1 hypothetical protein NIES2135_23020 [Leptolyngbya boryana NIES-2135]MBD1854351.1 hypothetical protein [Leptolyngbya sp. FACHB-1624]MBD2368369.1 hypothetical protein [Leptolyngbya sp. FACHB-161]MBD2374975.1 hypothetical protein [Leptolyngbya sp. FACHB-238]MBD2399395.1 hypothetical protein [Leptolyngbya sp. FACHB-239]